MSAPARGLIHRLADDQFDVIANGLVMLIAELRAANVFAGRTPEPEPTPAPAAKQWTFHDPRQKCEVGAWLDDREQVRHIPLDREDEVPGHWRKLLLA